MPLTLRNSARRRKNPDEERSEEAQVMAPTRMKLRVRRRDVTGGAAVGSVQPEEEEERSRDGSSRSNKRKNTSSASAAAAATSSSSPPSSSASASARAAMAAEASPDSKCPICLDRFNNLAYLDRCLHRFCFPCIQEWSHNKAECPLCKQPFASILHSVRAENDFKEYTLRPPPANSSVAATVAMVAAMASAARSDHQMRLMLRRHRGTDGGETTSRRRRRERGGGGGRAGEGTGVWEWYIDSPPLSLPPLPHHPAVSPVVAEDSEEGDDLEEQRMRGGADLAERGVIFEGLTGLGGPAVPDAPNDQASRRLMTRLAARQRLQREGGTVRRLRERETVAFRRALYRSGIRVRGVAGVSGNHGQQQQRDITAESFRRNPVHLNRLRPWLRRELTVLYGAHGSLVDIVQRIIMARLARHGLEDTPTIEEELRPFLLARTDHFLHELVSFARSPLNLENYDLQAVYEPPAAALELDGMSSSDSSSVIAISEGEDEDRPAGGQSEDRLLGRTGSSQDDVIQAGSCLSLSAWDDETPGPSYSTAEPSCSLTSLSPAPQKTANEEEGEKREEAEEECLIVGYKKPIAERTPELVQLSSDTEDEDEEKKEKEKEEEEDKVTEKPLPLPSTTPPLSYLPTIPPSTSGAYRDQQDKAKDGEVDGHPSRARTWSGSSGRSRNSVCTLSPATPGEGERRCNTESWRDRKRCGGEVVREKRRKKRRKGRERSSDRLRKSGTLYNPNRTIYPAMMRQRSHSPSPFHSSGDSGSPLPPSPADSNWEYHCSQVSPLTSSISSPSSSSSSSPVHSSPQRSSQTPLTPSLSPNNRSNAHHGEKPGGKRKYKSRHLDSKDPTWRPSSSHRREKRRERREKDRRRRARDGRDRHRKDSSGDSSSKRCREDRSPSVEIIYEGTISANATQPPARKRRRRRQRRIQNSSSPVIITLDSDSSHDDVNNKNNSNSSSPLSSQQTVDFSDLPPLPLVHSASVGGALNADIGELPVDILDRGSDGSETEPADQCEAAGLIAIDNSDHDVDVENVDGGGPSLGSHDGEGPEDGTKVTTAVNQRHAGTGDGSSEPTGDKDPAPGKPDPARKRDAEASTSDSRLLAAILNDLKGISEPRCDLTLSGGSDIRKTGVRDQREVSQTRSDQDDWSSKTRQPNSSLAAEQKSNDVGDQHLSFNSLRFGASVPTLPPVDQLKECMVRGGGRDVPPLLKQASPVRTYNRNTPPPLKHKDAGSPHLSPVSSIALPSPHAPDAAPVRVNSHADLSSDLSISHADSRLCPELNLDHQTIPPISTLKRHLTGALALREMAPAGSGSAADTHSYCHFTPSDSHSAAAPPKGGVLTSGVHSTFHKMPVDSRSRPEKSSPNADCSPHLDLNSFHSSKVHSSCDITEQRCPPADLHPVDSLSPDNFHAAKTSWLKDRPAHNDSTSRGCRKKTLSPNSSLAAPVDLHPSSCVANATRAGSDVFSGANCNDASLPVFVSVSCPRTQTPSSPLDSHSCSDGEKPSERLSPCGNSSVPTAAPSKNWSPIDTHPGSPASTAHAQSSSAAPAARSHEGTPRGCLPPIDLHRTTPAPAAKEDSSGFVGTVIEERLNHTALSSSAYRPSQRSVQPEVPVESHSKRLHPTDSDSKPHNHFDPSSGSPFPTDTCSKHHAPVDSQCESRPLIDSHSKNTQRDFELPRDNHVTSSPQSAESRWTSDSSVDAHSDSRLPIDEHSAGWNTHTHTHT